MKEFEYTVKDEQGIHARPAGYLVKLISGFKSDVTIEANGKSASGKRLIAVMSLGVKKNQKITVSVTGPDEEDAASKIKGYMEQNL